MALTGELSDLSLAELIEFFCNQRKTGRLTVVYEVGPGYFYLESGSVVHAHIGALRGIEAVYCALTLRNASFSFSPGFESPEHTINQPWTSVVLEGLRRMDEGITPAKPFVPEPAKEPKAAEAESREAKPKSSPAAETPERKPIEPPRKKPQPPQEVMPFLSQHHHASRFSSGPWKVGAVFAAILLVIAGLGVPWGWYARSKTVQPTNEVRNEPIENVTAPPSQVASESPATSLPNEETPVADTADLARRQREARLREEARAKAKASDAGNISTQSSASITPPVTKNESSSTSGKKVTVQVTYDENGRVIQASGGDATALRIARQKRFPAGKASSATITIPIN